MIPAGTLLLFDLDLVAASSPRTQRGDYFNIQSSSASTVTPCPLCCKTIQK